MADLNQTVMDVQRTDWTSAEQNWISSSRGRLNFLSWFRKDILCWAVLTSVSMLDDHFRSWQIVDPRNLKVSTADTMQLSTIRGAVMEGSSWKSTVSCSASLRSLFMMRLMTIVSSANFRSKWEAGGADTCLRRVNIKPAVKHIQVIGQLKVLQCWRFSTATFAQYNWLTDDSIHLFRALSFSIRCASSAEYGRGMAGVVVMVMCDFFQSACTAFRASGTTARSTVRTAATARGRRRKGSPSSTASAEFTMRTLIPPSRPFIKWYTR